MFDTSVKDWRGNIVGFRCLECNRVKDRMWGNVCDECREVERRHQELIAAIREAGKGRDGQAKSE